MQTIKYVAQAAIVAALFVLAEAQTFAQDDATAPAKALGFTEGQMLPDREPALDGGALLVFDSPGAAGLDRVLVTGTRAAGVCKVAGLKNISNPQGDNFGLHHEAEADELAERVAVKLGRGHTRKMDVKFGGYAERNPDRWPVFARNGNATDTYYWADADAEPFHGVVVDVEYGTVSVTFEFKCFLAAKAEQDAAEAVEF